MLTRMRRLSIKPRRRMSCASNGRNRLLFADESQALGAIAILKKKIDNADRLSLDSMKEAAEIEGW